MADYYQIISGGASIAALYVLLLFVALVVTQEIFHRFPRFTLALFSIASIVLFPCWILLFGVEDWFAWIKVFSIASGIILLSLFRTTRLGTKTLVRWSTYAFLVVNILEAVLKDITTGTGANYLNALAGILLIVTLNKIRTVHIDTSSKHKDLLWGSMTLPWIVGYTIWNWVFVYLNFGFQSSMMHIAVLASALVVVCVDKERWLQARVFTLGTFFIFFHSFPHLSSRLLAAGQNERFGLFVSMISSGFMILYTILHVRRSLLTKRK